MLKNYNTLLQKVENELTVLQIDGDNVIELSESSVKLLFAGLKELKTLIVNGSFADKKEEIHFFKYQKPVLVAKLIYYNTLYKTETKKPVGGEEVIRKYYKKELDKLKHYFDSNQEFYEYYRSGSTLLDEYYFIRSNDDVRLNPDTFYFGTDQSFSTSHDFKVAKIIANDMLQIYLQDQLNNTNQKRISGKSQVNWTSTKTALTELIYALYTQGVFDNGNADIKVITKTFERTFNIDLGDFYHTFLELKSRKINRTKFLDTLKENLIRKMDEQDGR